MSDKKWPVVSFNVSPRGPIEEFYNKCHDENGRFCAGPDGVDDSPESIAKIDKKGRSLAR